MDHTKCSRESSAAYLVRLSVVAGLLFTNFPVPGETNWSLFDEELKV